MGLKLEFGDEAKPGVFIWGFAENDWLIWLLWFLELGAIWKLITLKTTIIKREARDNIFKPREGDFIEGMVYPVLFLNNCIHKKYSTLKINTTSLSRTR